MTEWVGRNLGDHRVLCYEMKKVYSCPGSAALDTGLREREVEAICNRIVRYGVNNLKYDWYAQYLLENKGNIKFHPHPPKPYVPINIKNSQRYRLSKRNVGLRKFRGKIPNFHRIITDVFQDLGTDTIEMFAGDLIKLMKERSLNPRNPHIFGSELKTTSWAFIKHLKVHQKVYENILGLELSEKYKKSNSRMTTWIKMTYKEGVTKEDIFVYDDDESYLIKYRRNDVNPIVNLDTFRIYGSLRNAGKITKLDPKRILWCCLDDITSIQYNGRPVKFAFGRLEE